ncbi:putative bifunctional diguanylate cyclase/phosphodiesterase [Tomitella cavernea]|uniref:putative bifunctional diguanylate cyclase/phosphodiesterase n=1 Tax=Tomitella cavernea TaxID=1387982 RepID=UPI001904E99B|nr:GGDEF domain-containing protein [Tomitella cavernea]
MTRSLDALVTHVATVLMGADAASARALSEGVLGDVVGHFGVDASFLRRNEHDIRATRLVAEWPPRSADEASDPLRLVYFAGADPVFAAMEDFTEPTFIRPGPETSEYQRHIRVSRRVAVTSVAAVPLRSGDVTTGSLGFVKFGDRSWDELEVNALQAIASLFAQLHGRIEAEERLRHIADHDELTGLYNRRALFRELDRRLSADHGDCIPILFLDLDRFKSINDYLGHAVGDEFLRGFADRLREQAMAGDLVARLGGDEFVILPARPMTTSGAYAEATRIRRAVREYVSVGGEQVIRTVSMGVALAAPGAATTTSLMRRADTAARTAKQAGGDSVTVLSAEMSAEADFRSDVEMHLPAAIAHDELLLHYQPEADLRTGRILAVEALVRWQHPARGLLPPGEFVGVAESMNLAGALGDWVLRRACRDFSSWRTAGAPEDVVLRVNVSPAQLVSTRIVGTVEAALTEYGLPGSALCLEITEHVVVRDLDAIRGTLRALQALGVYLAIDDFGTGASVLSHLKHLPVDVLKIDQGFVRNLGRNAADLAIVRAIISLAAGFGHEIVAEGVETSIAATMLLELGCHRAQGFLLYPPVPADAMAALLVDADGGERYGDDVELPLDRFRA